MGSAARYSIAIKNRAQLDGFAIGRETECAIVSNGLLLVCVLQGISCSLDVYYSLTVEISVFWKNSSVSDIRYHSILGPYHTSYLPVC